MSEAKIIDWLQALASGREKIPETPKFVRWRNWATFLGFFFNTLVGSYCLYRGDWFGGVIFVIIWNGIWVYLVMATKLLRHVTRWYRKLYLVVAFGPLFLFLGYYSFWFFLIRYAERHTS